MNIDVGKILLDNIPAEMKQPRRGQIYVGFKCGQKCGFCYYKDRCHEKMFPFEDIKTQIDYEYSYGIRDFEITGGEPSEYQNLRDVCQYIKDKNPKSRIAIITNGGLYVKDVWDLIDEVLVSYHLGSTDYKYDHQIFPLGSTYKKCKRTIDIARAEDKMVRTNTVVGTFNMDGMDFVVDDLLEFQPDIVNFLPVNVFDQATSMGKYIDYCKLRPILKRQIRRIEENSKARIFIRYMPFCDMEGFEHHIVGHVQHIFDWFDWNIELDGVHVVDMAKRGVDLGKYGEKSMLECMNARKSMYFKSQKCFNCRYNIICDGVEKVLQKNRNADDQFIPSPGKFIKNPMFFLGESTYDLYKEKYSD